jgi:hypothetical protein
METLCKVFPQGLPAHEPGVARSLRQALEEWEDTPGDAAIQAAWIRFVLLQTLGLPAVALKEGQGIPSGLKAERPEAGVTIRPELALMPLPKSLDLLSLDDEDNTEAEASALPLLLIQTFPRSQKLDRPLKGTAWTASPRDRMAELLTQTRVPVGLVTNGEEWVLIHRVTETTGLATFSAPLWLDEPLTLRAFKALLGPERFFGNPAESLAQLLADSEGEQTEVTDQLGYQVRAAVEMLVQALDRIDRDRSGALLAGVAEAELYEGVLTLMMRLVFLLCAEEREMFPTDEETYSAHYAVSTLLAQLQAAADEHGEELLERRCDAWSRLLATFRAIHGGVRHEAMRLPAYGGKLLDPTRFPWLDGAPLPVSNRTVLHLLEALQLLRIKVPGGRGFETRRLSFRALDIEQIGHVYEGLLDHAAVRATEPILGLVGTRDREPEVPLSTLETLLAEGRKPLLKFLAGATGRSEKALETALAENKSLDEGRWLSACEGDAALLARVRPFAGLVRLDDFGRFTLIPTGSLYVTDGKARRSTGTHYTPRFLAEQITAQTLKPLVYTGVSEGDEPSPETLESPARILELRVCDPTVGSGAFLVAACRYLAERLCEAWTRLEEENPGAVLVSPEGALATGDPAERLLPGGSDTPEERLILARRLVAERCLYGVDKNPMAVEIAKLALWLVTMNRGKPFHFLDHAIKAGDSLLGLHETRQFREWAVAEEIGAASKLDLFSTKVFDELTDLRQRLIHVEDTGEKERLHRLCEAKAERVRLMGDLILVPELMEAKPKVQMAKRNELQSWFTTFSGGEKDADLRAEADALLGESRPFHWPLEFADIYRGEGGGGFHAMMGNPPFMGGQKITGELGVPYREYLVRHVGRGKKGSADLVAYFFLRAMDLLRDGGCLGLIATNTLAQGDTREVGLDQLIGSGYGIYAAESSRPWPGKAALEVAIAHLIKGVWTGVKTLNETKTRTITAFLDDGTSSGKPFRLKANAGKSFQGSIVLGMGFVLTLEEAQALMAKNEKNAEVLFPYLNGEDLNSRPDQSPSRWVINFKDWPLGRIGQELPVSGETMLHLAETMDIRSLSSEWRPKAESRWETADEKRRDKWLQIGIVPSDYPDPVAADYPDCLEIVERLVKPERQRKNDKVEYVLRYPLPQRFWHYGEKRPALYETIAELPRVLVIPLVSKYLNTAFESAKLVYSHATGVVASDSMDMFAVIQGTFHEIWVRQLASSLETRLRYTPSDCFETFPFPDLGDARNSLGKARVTVDFEALATVEMRAGESPTTIERETTAILVERDDAGEASFGVRERLERIGEAYHAHRKSVCAARQLGLTKVYNLFHDPKCDDGDIAELRRLHAEMDDAVRDAYGWSDLNLRHGFYGDGKESRYTLHPEAKGEVLRRLLALNHERHAQEQEEEAEIAPALAGEAAQAGKARRAKKVREASAAYGQLTTDDLLVEQLIADRAPAPAPSHTEALERAAELATYLVMRASAPTRLDRLRGTRSRRRTSAQAYHRARLAKHLYFAQEMFPAVSVEKKPLLALNFTRHPRGPYTRQIEDVELLSVNRGWLQRAASDPDDRKVSMELGPRADEAVLRVLERLGPDEEKLDAELIPLDEAKMIQSERWTTVHWAFRELQREGKAGTREEVQKYINGWKPMREAFSLAYIAEVYQELKLRGFLTLSGSKMVD